MIFEEFKDSLTQAAPPEGLSVDLQAMWWDGKGQWDKSHEVIQDVSGKNAAWIHAYLHRKEGDLGNAGYWYSRAGKGMPSITLEEEWKSLVEYFLMQTAK